MTNYKINEEKMFVDITDNVAIIINSESGTYYGLNGFGTSVFENLLKGISTQAILDELKKIPDISPEIAERFDKFVADLVEKELLIASDETSDAAANINTKAAAADEFVLSVNEYNDAQELLLADPIHEVREETGWSPEQASLNPDKEDVARRELKVTE